MEIDEDLRAFLVESHENLSQLEGDLVALEQQPEDQELIQRIYRSLHTIKGNCGFLGFENLESLAHGGENLLSRLRDHHLVLNAPITNALLQVLDAIRYILSVLEIGGTEGDRDFSDLIQHLIQLQMTEGSVADAPTAVSTEPQSELIISPTGIGAQEEQVTNAQQEEQAINVGINVTARATLEVSDLGIGNSEGSEDESPHSLIGHHLSVTENTIRVDVDLLDTLMNLVGELVLHRNQVLEVAARLADRALLDTSQRLDLVTTQLQESVMRTRMQPIRRIWHKFPRVVRDLAFSLDKQVGLQMEGEETELDKTLIQAIADPLTHLVRNSVDHGIELPDIRIAANKPSTGTLRLRASHESGHVNIEVADDGAGIDTQKLIQKALQRNLVTTTQAAQMSEQDALNLIFLPGLSTANKITNVSGRGVGMDVVRTNIEAIGGTIDVQSRQHVGTIFKLKIPLTLAIIPTLIVMSCGERYAIPQSLLVELVRLEGDQAKQSIERVHGAPVYRLRGQLLPLVDLSQELGSHYRSLESITDPDVETVLNIVVLQVSTRSFGLVVDTIQDTQEIVVKSLSKHLKGIQCFTGATIMGDGRVALILDIPGLAKSVHLLSEEEEEKTLSRQDSPAINNQQAPKPFLLCQGPNHRQMAIPLSEVARLEQFQWTEIEPAGTHHVIQYRQQILPLVYLSDVLGHTHNQSCSELQEQNTDIQVVVISTPDSATIGLVVEQIEDIVMETITVRGPSPQENVECLAVIQDKVTELLEINAIAQTATAQFGWTQVAVS